MAHVRLTPPFGAYGGRCWTASLDRDVFPETDTPADPSASTLILSEDDVDLGPPHTAHQLILRDGAGAYSHWAGQLYFSTSDGSDPNHNGRCYTARRDSQKYFCNRARHASAIVESYLRCLPGGRAAIDGARILEIGPGRDMGTVLLLAGLGAQTVSSVDRFAGRWQRDWHPAYVDALTAVAAERFAIDLAPIAADAAASQSFTTGGIAHFPLPLEGFAQTGLSFDVTLSHSVFEHFYSVADAATALLAVSAPASIGAHHVDFRDHRNFGEPLEFLLVPDDDYRSPVANDDYGRGNRVRADEMTALLRSAGFGEVAFTPETSAPDDYLDSFEKRLRVSSSRFNGHPRSVLAILSGRYLLRRAP